MIFAADVYLARPFTIQEHIIVMVKDEGIGIPPANQQHLFDAFHRGDNVGEIRGVGLGLSIVKQFVELHGGTISVESEVGQGTTFRIMLPILSENTWPVRQTGFPFPV